MKTLIAWLIANIGGVTAVLLFAVYEILLLCGAVTKPDDTADFWKMSLVGLAAISICCELFGGIQGSKSSTDVANLIIMAAVYYFAFDHVRYVGTEIHQLTAFAWRIIPCVIFAVAVALFTFFNMDEVVSMRMLYQNSNAEMFEIGLLYTMNRFTAALSAAGSVSLLYFAFRVWNVLFQATA